MLDDILMSIVHSHGTPVYAYDLSTINDRVSMLSNALNPQVQILYSVKSNPNIGIIQYLSDKVYGFEVASEGELCIALNAGVLSKRIIFVGPGKTKAELEYAIISDILAIVVESIQEIKYIQELAMLLDKKVSILVRINPQKDLTNAKIKMTAKQFGIQENEWDNTIKELKRCSKIQLLGIHVYRGTQVLDAFSIVESIRETYLLTNRLEKAWREPFKIVDFGGGFGIPYFEGEKPLDLLTVTTGIINLFHEQEGNRFSEHISFFAESGRFLVAESGYFLCEILYKKVIDDKIILITDGGSNNHSAAAGIGRFVRHNFPMRIISKTSPINQTEIVDIVGPLCTPTDIIAQNIELPIAKPGDILVVEKSGAYGLSASMTGFLSHVTPPEVVFINNDISLIKTRGNKEDYLKNYISIQSIT